MNNKNRIRKLQRITTLAKNHESIELGHWSQSKKNLDDSINRYEQLTQYFDNYKKPTDTKLNILLYQNQQSLLDWLRDGMKHQLSEIEKTKLIESEKLANYVDKIKERKIYEKLTDIKSNKLTSIQTQQDNKTLEEIVLRFHLKK